MSLSSFRSPESAAALYSANFGRDPCGPLRRVPLLDRPDRRPARAQRRDDLGRRLARAADCARSGDDDALRVGHSRHPSAGRPSTSSGLRKARQLLEPPKPSELDSAIRTRCWRGSPRTTLTSQSGSISRRFALTGSGAGVDRQRAHRGLDGARRGDEVAHHALGRAYRDACGNRRRTPRAPRRTRCGRSSAWKCRARSSSPRRRTTPRRRAAPGASPGWARRPTGASR